MSTPVPPGSQAGPGHVDSLNNHGSDTYLRYFPLGYGNALRETPEQIRETARVILGQLEKEPDPWLVTFHGRIARALATFGAAQDLGDAAAGDRREAIAYVVAERRSWVQALSVSRLEASIAYLDDQAYVRRIFSPADVRRRAAMPALEESDGLPATTSQPYAQETRASLRLLPASAVSSVQALAGIPAKAPAELRRGTLWEGRPRVGKRPPCPHDRVVPDHRVMMTLTCRESPPWDSRAK